ncbi:IS30 family transposase [Mycetocola sp. 2940]|uniref:IS30 family transposase n=1 Tax=Mycetocola sp. 2940 TaxID=3156452 RepID=UPI00339284E0
MSPRFSERMLGDVVERLWDLRQQGLTTEQIGVDIGWEATAVRRHIHQHGGVRPRWGRALKGRSLTLEERIEIQALHRAKVGIRPIARQLGRSPSTITRELQRHRLAGRYRATTAQARAFQNARRPKPSKLATNPELRGFVQNELQLKRSPEQIAGRLRREFPDRPEMRVSPETIYQSVYLLARGGLKRELEKKLRTGRVIRRYQRRDDERRGRIQDMVLIADRPAEATDRAVPGHWEGDLIIGKDGHSAIGTVVERHSGYLLLIYLDPDKNRVDAVRDGLITKLKDLPDKIRRTLTWDQGTEMHKHKEVSVAADIDIYFCDPHSPWQRPTNENTNGLLRQYFPKGTDLSVFSQEDLDYVEWEMNDRPRKRLEFAKPAEVIEQVLLQ